MQAGTPRPQARPPKKTPPVSKKVLQLFWDLAEAKQDKRSAAAENLLQDIKAAEAGKGNKGPTGTADSLQAYALKRLVAGLDSSRKAARQGFALALTQVLEQTSVATPEEVIEAIEATIDVSNSRKGSELRDALLGRIFGYAALIRSGKLADKWPLLCQCLQELARLAKKRAFLHEVTAGVLLSALEPLEAGDLGALLGDCPGVVEFMSGTAEEGGPEALWMMVALWPKLPTNIRAGLAMAPDSQPADLAKALFTPQHLQKAVPALLATSDVLPHLHGAWAALFKLAGTGSKSGKRLASLWEQVAEEGLLKSSHDRQALALQLFAQLLPLTGTEAKALVSPQLMHVLTVSQAHSESHLHVASQRALKALIAFMGQADQALQLGILNAVCEAAGGLQHAKMLPKLLQGLQPEGVAAYSQALMAQFLHPSTVLPRKAEANGPEASAGDAESEAFREAAVDVLCTLGRPGYASSAQCMVIVRFLTVHAFFQCTDASSKVKVAELAAAGTADPPITSDMRRHCLQRLLTVLGTCMKPPPKPRGPKRAKLSPDGSLEDILAGFGATMAALLKSKAAKVDTRISAQSLAACKALSKAGQAVEEAAGKLQAATTRTEGASTEAEEKAEANGNASTPPNARLAHVAKALQRLCIMLCPYALEDPLTADAQTCEGVRSLADSFAAGTFLEGDRTEQGLWHNSAMDVILGLMATGAGGLPFTPLREASEQLFRHSCHLLTPAGMAQMLEVLERPFLPGRGDSDDEDMDMSSDDEDGPMENGLAAADSEEDESDLGVDEKAASSEEEESEEAESSDEDNAEADVDTPAAVQEADDESEPPDMDDEAMFAITPALTAALREAATNSSSGRAATREAIAHFKLRVLALLDLLPKHTDQPPHLLMPLPVFCQTFHKAANPQGNQVVASRIRAVTMRYLDRVRPAKLEAVPSVSQLAELLKQQAQCVCTLKQPAQQAASAKGFERLLTASILSPGATGEHRAAAEAELQGVVTKQFSTRHCAIPTTGLIALVRSVPSLGVTSFATVMGFALKARTDFLQLQALQLTSAMARLPQDHVWPQLSDEVLSTIITKLTPEVLSAPKANKPKARLQMLQELRMLINALKALDKNAAGVTEQLCAARDACVTDMLRQCKDCLDTGSLLATERVLLERLTGAPPSQNVKDPEPSNTSKKRSKAKAKRKLLQQQQNAAANLLKPRKNKDKYNKNKRKAALA